MDPSEQRRIDGKWRFVASDEPEVSSSSARQHSCRHASAIGISENMTFRSGTIYVRASLFTRQPFEQTSHIELLLTLKGLYGA